MKKAKEKKKKKKKKKNKNKVVANFGFIMALKR